MITISDSYICLHKCLHFCAHYVTFYIQQQGHNTKSIIMKGHSALGDSAKYTTIVDMRVRQGVYAASFAVSLRDVGA